MLKPETVLYLSHSIFTSNTSNTVQNTLLTVTTHRQTDKQTDRQTDRQTNQHTGSRRKQRSSQDPDDTTEQRDLQRQVLHGHITTTRSSQHVCEVVRTSTARVPGPAQKTRLVHIYTVSRKKVSLYFRLQLLHVLVDFYNFYTIGNRNEYFTIKCNLLT